MKIGIFTYHDINNYGAQLQAASVQRFLAGAGFEAELIDYKPFRHELRRVMTVARALKSGNLAAARQEHRRNRMFRRAIGDMAELSERRTFTAKGAAALAHGYDVLICGSDELWNFGNYLGYQSPYILDFPEAGVARKISYAASIGSLSPDAALRSRMKEALTRFSAILVRDPTTQAFVEAAGLSAQRVLDPTFISDLDPIAPAIRDYMMISGGMKPTQVAHAVETARRMGLRPVTVGLSYPGHGGLMVPATPREWIGYVRHAAGHVTSLFHGAALSLKYDTPFAVFLTPGKEQKIRSLLDWFQQEDRTIAPEADTPTIEATLSKPLRPDLPEIRDALVSRSQKLLIDAIG